MTVQQQPAAFVRQPQQRKAQGLSFLVHGLPKAGKSTFADSGPVPRLVLDVEGSSYWTPSRKIYWDPLREPPPVPDGSWDTAIVLVREARTVSATYRVLNSGQHPFNSCSMDSVTEIQQRVIDDLAGNGKIERDHWNALLRQVSSMVRQYRDLITHPVKPMWTMTFVAGTHLKEGRWRPMVQGQAQDYLPYYVDVLGYLGAQQDGNRLMFIGPHPQFETGERLGGRLPYTMKIGDVYHPGYTAETMLTQVLQGRRN
jgi:AAA domain